MHTIKIKIKVQCHSERLALEDIYYMLASEATLGQIYGPGWRPVLSPKHPHNVVGRIKVNVKGAE